jgi:hypothetical protein
MENGLRIKTYNDYIAETFAVIALVLGNVFFLGSILAYHKLGLSPFELIDTVSAVASVLILVPTILTISAIRYRNSTL